MAGVDERLPEGVHLLDLQTHEDERGSFTEVFRRDWAHSPEPVQWNVVNSKAGVLRGVHVHRRHDDYLLLAKGRASIGLSDLRRGSPTYRLAACVTMSADKMQAIVIPHGVAHGFYFPEPSMHIYGVTYYWDPDDEAGCRWDDPALGIPWPCTAPVLSPRDAELGSLASLMERIPL